MKCVATVSFGKDSTAMLLKLIDKSYPLDEVVFYDTGMEFKAIYNVRDKIMPMLLKHGIKYTELKPKTTFLYNMLERPVLNGKNGPRIGLGWCGGACRWGTSCKTRAVEACHKSTDKVYIGIAADEPKRLERLKLPKCAPLAEWGMTEAECLAYCREQGISWEENGVDLYDILDRVSCWCCANKNRKELKNIYLYLPEYWEKLKKLQSQIPKPMKRYSRNGINYGNVFDMEKVFKAEIGG